MPKKIQLSAIVPADLNSHRLDKALASLFPDYSRTRLQSWIKQGDVTVNRKNSKQRDPVRAGDCIQIYTQCDELVKDQAEAIPLSIIYEDKALIVLEKPAGLVVHPGAGRPRHTLVNALLNYDATLAQLPRAGIVHRLDKDTSGIMVVARTYKSYTLLVDAFQRREIKRAYEAIVYGELVSGGTVDRPIARHPYNRKKRAVMSFGRAAITRYRILNRFSGYTHIEVHLETGRTHQIRVHMNALRYPLVGDPLYGTRTRLAAGISSALRDYISGFKRQALHARSLELTHPESRKIMCWQATLPDDMQGLLERIAGSDRTAII